MGALQKKRVCFCFEIFSKVFANTEEINDKNCFFMCFVAISEDEKGIDFKDNYEQIWRIEKQ